MTMSTSQQIQAMVSNSARSCSLARFLGAHNGVNGKEVKSLSISDNAVTGYILSIISMNQELKEPFYVLDLGMVASIMNKWCGSLPNVCPFYAVKCNPDPELLRALAVLGANFDCASQAEIESILALGVSTDRIIYANPCKAEAHIKYAARIGVNLTTFDSRDEIEKIRKWHPKCSLLLRIKPLETDETMRGPLGRKYGALPEEITPLLEAAQAADVSVVGVAFHVGSGGSDSHVYHSAIAYAKAIFDTASKLGMPRMHVLDIGGGFTMGRQFDDAAVTIKKAIDTYFPNDGDYGGHGLTLISEPGRFFAETPFTLVTNVIGKRVRRELHEYWINDGIYGSMNCIINDHATVNPTPLAWSSNRDNLTCGGLRTYPSTVFGPTCDAFDTVLTHFQLPELQVNDWLVFPNMGAYTASTGSKFNGFDISAISTYPYMVYESNLNCHKDVGIHEQNYN